MLLDPADVSDKNMQVIAQYLTDDSIIQKNREMKEKAQQEAEETEAASEASANE